MSPFRSRVAAVALVGWGLAAPAGFGQTTARPAPPARVAAVAANSRTGTVNVRDLTADAGPKAIPRVDGVAAPGLKLSLDGSTSSGGRLWYRWIQTQGPPVTIVGSDQAAAACLVPEDAMELGFVLVVGNAVGVDARALAVEVTNAERTEDEAELRAAAGADQTVSVGRRVVLDGKASEPRGRVRYRWMQVGGPKTLIQATAGTTCSFTPEAAGDYQFALLVIGTTGLVSDPALITVHACSTRPGSEGYLADDPTMIIDELARRSLASVPGGASKAGDLAQAFEAVASRADLNRTYVDAASELSRRLDGIIPRDLDRRAEWLDRFVKPVTAKLAGDMRATGLDLSQTSDQEKPLNKSQRSRLAEQFRFVAAGLRAADHPR